MNSLLLSVAVLLTTFPQETNQPAGQGAQGRTDGKMQTQRIDGEWTAVYVEMDGKKLESKGFTNVSIKNNVVTCNHDGKAKSWRLEFGPHHMVRSTEQDGERTGTSTSTQEGTQNNNQAANQPNDRNNQGIKSGHTHYGVYVASQDYLCLSFDKGSDHRFRAGEGREGTRPGTQTGTQPGAGAQPPQGTQIGTQPGTQPGGTQPGAQPRQQQPGAAGGQMYWQSEGPRGSALVLILRRASSGEAQSNSR